MLTLKNKFLCSLKKKKIKSTLALQFKELEKEQTKSKASRKRHNED